MGLVSSIVTAQIWVCTFSLVIHVFLGVDSSYISSSRCILFIQLIQVKSLSIIISLLMTGLTQALPTRRASNHQKNSPDDICKRCDQDVREDFNHVFLCKSNEPLKNECLAQVHLRLEARRSSPEQLSSCTTSLKEYMTNGLSIHHHILESFVNVVFSKEESCLSIFCFFLWPSS